MDVSRDYPQHAVIANNSLSGKNMPMVPFYFPTTNVTSLFRRILVIASFVKLNNVKRQVADVTASASAYRVSAKRDTRCVAGDFNLCSFNRHEDDADSSTSM